MHVGAKVSGVCSEALTGSVCSVPVTTGNGYTPMKLINGQTGTVVRRTAAEPVARL